MNQSQTSAALLTNLAAGHGLIRWIDESGDWAVFNEFLKTDAPLLPIASSRSATLHAMAFWFLKCLRVDHEFSTFREGWHTSSSKFFSSQSPLELGHLCRLSPDLISKKAADGVPLQQAAMFECYRNLLMYPELERSSEVDDHVDTRLEDIQLSEKVYQYNYQPRMHALLQSLSDQERFGGRDVPIVIIDVGAGNGNVLFDVSQTLYGLGYQCICIAVDPSDTARQACRDLFASCSYLSVVTLEGDVETPDQLFDRLLLMNVDVNRCLIIAKSSLHDRSISKSSSSAFDQQCQSLESVDFVTAGDYVYRDEEWKPLHKDVVSSDLTKLLNKWHSVFQHCMLIVMESHLVPSSVVNHYRSHLAIIPAYLSHALSGQYLLSYQAHLQAMLSSDFRNVNASPLHSLQSHPLMSFTLIES